MEEFFERIYQTAEKPKTKEEFIIEIEIKKLRI